MTLGRFCSLAGLGSSLVLAALACSTTSSTSSTASNLPECNSPDFDGYPLGIRCNALVDEVGRRVQLHGVNARVQGLFDVSFDDGRVPLHAVPDFTDDDAKRIRDLGFDSVRLPINWSGLEPTEGDGFNQAYLVRLDAILAICKRWNLLVLLSLHQDGYSKEIGQDGAPLWAIRPAPDQLLEGPLADGLEQRNLSAQVTRAFVTFFGPSPEGAYLRQRFIAMAAFVLRRYADEPAVFGLDIFNEPVSSDPQSLAFFRQAIPELRNAAPRKLLFFQPAAVRNLTDYASDGNGSLGAGTVYAPHIYTAVFDRDETRRLNLMGDDLRPSYRRALEEASSHHAPLAVGEYGYFPTASNYEEYVRGAFAAQDEVFASSFFWVWKENSQSQWGFFDYDPIQKQWSERPDVLRMHARPFVSRLAGRLMETEYDAKTARLRLRFLGDPNVTAPNLFTVGEMAEFRNRKARAQCDGAALALEGDRVFQVPCHGAGEHVLTFGPDR